VMFDIKRVEGFVVESIYVPYYSTWSSRVYMIFDTEDEALIVLYRNILNGEFVERDGYWLQNTGNDLLHYIVYHIAYKVLTVSSRGNSMLGSKGWYFSDGEFDWVNDVLELFEPELGGFGRV